MYLLSCGAHHKLLGDEQARVDALHAASLLMGRFNPAGFIRAWNEPERVGYAIIDCMMNLSLLFWAGDITGDPRFANVARIHADTTLRDFLRDDGSVCHIVEFDPNTGRRVREHGGQGYAEGTAWSRGQAWGLYGFAMAYANTGDKRYLDAAKAIASFFIAHIRPDGLTDCDFSQPKEPQRLDNIAGACGACGLLELHRLTGEERCRAAAERLVDGLIERCANLEPGVCGILTHCTASYHDDAAGVHTNIVYGDFFLIEALLKLAGRDAKLWYSREASR
jgi:unsaturated chondroitin disaccharide hydrolase